VTSVQSLPPGYEAAAAALISAGVPEPIANDPNDTSGLAGWAETRLAALDPKTCILVRQRRRGMPATPEEGAMSAASITGGSDYTEGSVIEYEAFGGVRRRVKVETVEPDVKNGRPGFDGVIVSAPAGDLPAGQSVWGYDDQITEVISR